MYQGKSVLVIGAAKSGIAAARFLAQQGARVTISDQKKGDALAGAKQQLSSVAVTWEEGGNNPATALAADLIVTSPGASQENPALTAAANANKEVIGEVELAYRHLLAPMVAITGSNGKSTTTMLVGEMLKQSNKNTFVGGNIGTPLIEAAERPFDSIVAEISSFQMEWAVRFQPKVAAILNISPNHLDRHASFEEYRDLKLKLLTKLSADGVAVWNASDPVLATHCPRVIGARERLTFSLNKRDGVSAWREGDSFCVMPLPSSSGKAEGRRPGDPSEDRLRMDSPVNPWDDGEERGIESYAISLTKLRGDHNHENILAAILLARSMGATPEGVRLALQGFGGLAHRLESIRTIDGVEYVNDSKATSVAAAVCALEAFPSTTKIILLVGGKDKGGSYAPLAESARERCKTAIVFGEAKQLIKAALSSTTRVETTDDIEQAVALARRVASAGDVVLLAPACSSYDQFPNFEVRGDTFRRIVQAL